MEKNALHMNITPHFQELWIHLSSFSESNQWIKFLWLSSHKRNMLDSQQALIYLICVMVHQRWIKSCNIHNCSISNKSYDVSGLQLRRSVCLSNRIDNLRIVIDTGAYLSVTRNQKDFDQNLVMSDVSELNGLSHLEHVVGKGTV